MYFSMAVLLHSDLVVTVICITMCTVYKIMFCTFNLEGHWNVQVFFPPPPFSFHYFSCIYAAKNQCGKIKWFRYRAIPWGVTVIHLIVQGGPRKSSPPFCMCPCYCINSCIHAVLWRRATFSWPPLRVGHEKVARLFARVLATVLIPVFMLCYGDRLLFHDPPLRMGHEKVVQIRGIL